MFIHTSPSAVFDAITQPEHLRRWFVDTAVLSPRKGGRYAFGWEGGPTHTGTLLEFVPGKRITLSWRWPGHEDLPATKLKMSVAPKDGGTVLLFTHTGFLANGPWVDLHDGAIRGWTYFMMNLKSVLEHGFDLRSPNDW
jgi:uncharacterized protein YndB with AHSA1/START domain